MTSKIPPARPKATRAEILQILADNGVSLAETPVVVLGWRGYYANMFGAKGRNDRDVYDDAVFVVGAEPNEFRAFNANVDASKYKKGIANLVAGLVYKFVKWRHRGQYKALQIVRDVVTRDGIAGTDTGRHGINFHRGGIYGTGSEGCQTFPPAQYNEFQVLSYELLDKYNLETGVYLLIEK